MWNRGQRDQDRDQAPLRMFSSQLSPASLLGLPVALSVAAVFPSLSPGETTARATAAGTRAIVFFSMSATAKLQTAAESRHLDDEEVEPGAEIWRRQRKILPAPTLGARLRRSTTEP